MTEREIRLDHNQRVAKYMRVFAKTMRQNTAPHEKMVSELMVMVIERLAGEVETAGEFGAMK